MASAGPFVYCERPGGRRVDRSLLWLAVLAGLLLTACGSGGEAAREPDANPAARAETGGQTAARRFHTASTLADGSILLTGGFGADAVVATAEVYVP